MVGLLEKNLLHKEVKMKMNYFFHFQTQSLSRSKADLFRDKLAVLLNIERENVDVFSVQLRRKHPALTDVRFAAHGSPYYKPVRLNGIVLMHREEVNSVSFLTVHWVREKLIFKNNIIKL